jgi:hypothetical protein
MEEEVQPEPEPEIKHEEKMDEEEKEEERPKSGFRVVEPGKATTTSVTKRIIKAEAAVKAEPQLESVP